MRKGKGIPHLLDFLPIEQTLYPYMKIRYGNRKGGIVEWVQ